jgi:hypothetical protein
MPLAPIDLSAGGGVPVTTNLVVSRTGERLYVLAGTPQHGPLIGSQLGRVLVVGARTGGLAEAIPLGEYGVQWIFLR